MGPLTPPFALLSSVGMSYLVATDGWARHGSARGNEIMRAKVSMRLQSTAVLAGLAWAAATGAASAHHSFAMFDMEHPIEISGTVKEFKFVSPHTLLILQVKGDDGVVKD